MFYCRLRVWHLNENLDYRWRNLNIHHTRFFEKKYHCINFKALASLKSTFYDRKGFFKNSPNGRVAVRFQKAIYARLIHFSVLLLIARFFWIFYQKYMALRPLTATISVRGYFLIRPHSLKKFQFLKILHIIFHFTEKTICMGYDQEKYFWKKCHSNVYTLHGYGSLLYLFVRIKLELYLKRRKTRKETKNKLLCINFTLNQKYCLTQNSISLSWPHKTESQLNPIDLYERIWNVKIWKAFQTNFDSSTAFIIINRKVSFLDFCNTF